MIDYIDTFNCTVVLVVTGMGFVGMILLASILYGMGA
jgi:Na+-transporting methylmalonyl-CoA/oxaloacetate decarboxylase gamma subunit